MQKVIGNKKYKILTPNGFKSFDGIVKSEKETIKICFYDNTYLTCTLDHILRVDGVFIEAEDVLIGSVIEGKKVVDILSNGVQEVYDPINVSDGNLYISSGVVSHNCNFLGSSFTLINGSTLSKLSPKRCVFSNDGLDVYKNPEEGHIYVGIVDTAKGTGNDSSAISIIDITEAPYEQVAKYKNNKISPLLFPTVIHKIATEYNEAYVLIEINSSEQVANILHSELEYENILTVYRGKGGQTVGSGFGKGVSQLGVNTDKKVKRIGCLNLKSLIEESKLLIFDADTISELTTFVSVKDSYEADDTYNDDLVMTLVLFAWLTTCQFFKDLSDVNLRDIIYKTQMEKIEQELTPFGFINDGREDEEQPLNF